MIMVTRMAWRAVTMNRKRKTIIVEPSVENKCKFLQFCKDLNRDGKVTNNTCFNTGYLIDTLDYKCKEVII